jgi:hypothetical protein
MSWNAMLIDGPLEGHTMTVDEESCDDPPAAIDVEGQRYIYCGFAENTPRYRHDGVAETV